MLPYAKLQLKDIKSSEIIERVKAYRERFGEDMVYYTALTWIRGASQEEKEQRYLEVMEKALLTNTPIRPPRPVDAEMF